MYRFKDLYKMVDAPKRHDKEGTPLFFAIARDNGAYRSVKAYSDEVTMNDAMLSFVNDQIFAPNAVPYAHCHLDVVSDLYRNEIVSTYVGSYVKGCNV